MLRGDLPAPQSTGFHQTARSLRLQEEVLLRILAFSILYYITSAPVCQAPIFAIVLRGGGFEMRKNGFHLSAPFVCRFKYWLCHKKELKTAESS